MRLLESTCYCAKGIYDRLLSRAHAQIMCAGLIFASQTSALCNVEAVTYLRYDRHDTWHGRRIDGGAEI